ncbi:MAG: TIGR01777 family oxidoreductase [Coxiellaceae bacterium]|nr:TIGR01777 family oxidoreductase [Coxiellaceae bacterium]
MKILIAGASGMIGNALVLYLSKQHQLILLGRKRDKLASQFSNQYPILTWDDLSLLNQDFLKSIDVIINLAGENIGERRWSFSQKEKIINSRVNATKKLAELCSMLGENSPRILNAGGIGIYGFSEGDHFFTEKSRLSDDPNCFLSKVSHAWEDALLPAINKKVSVVKMRFGVVLSKQGGALKKMLPAFKWGFGATLGNGNQSFSWVSIDDLVRAIDFIILNEQITGAVNIVAPGVVTQHDFAKVLAHILHRPFFLRMPALLVRILFGQMGNELLLKGQYVKSETLLKSGFEFQYSKIDVALNHLLHNRGALMHKSP